ncbi:deoxyribonuclease IV [Anaerobacillus sp. MEB173]|uniref:deoxyribonuclease IV n=1 Tax=Anaerobacillus sp. MEB173 TaxID=3383345 RepID=UPI003F90E878
MYIGSHMSIRNGYFHAAKEATSIGATAFQYFPKNPRSLSIKDFDKVNATQCAQYCKENNLKSIAHSPYPTKLIPSTKAEEQKVIKSLLNDLEITEACGSIGTVVHFGTAKADLIEAYKKMIDLLNQVLEQWVGKSLILIENNAGAGTNIGITLEEMVHIRKLSAYPEKIGFCLDTCHAYASGLWNGEYWSEIVKKGEQLGYFQHLKAIHLNNSKYPSGKRKDRHANIATGYITKAQWIEFLHSVVVANIPLILETPEDEKITHAEEIQLVKKWLTEEN